MKKIFSILSVFTLFCSSVKAQASAEELLQKMYMTYAKHWHKTFVFDQTTQFFRNDSLLRTEIWHEYIQYPDKMRIQIGDSALGNFTIYSADSSFSFRSGKSVRRRKGANELIFFLGGMYSYTFPEIVAHYKELNFDLTKFRNTIYNGRKVYVIGSSAEDEKRNQLWIDAEKLVPVRYFSYEGGNKLEATFEKHVQLKGAWTETESKFWLNDKLFQTEVYSNIRADVPIDPRLFEVK